MKKILYLFAALSLFCSCQKIYQENWEELAVDKAKYTYGASDVKGVFYVYFNGDWTAELTKGSDWATLDRTSGSGVYGNHIRFSKNTAMSRAAEITIKAGESTKVIKIIQNGLIAVPKIVFQKSSVNLLAHKTSVTLKVASNVPMDQFKEIVPTIAYPDTVKPWINMVTILEKVDSVEIPDMPDGTMRYVLVEFNENDLGKDRQGAIELAVTDASGTKYSGAVAINHSCDYPQLSLPAEDRVSKVGGVRTIPITTNIGEDITGASIIITYGDVQGFITDARVTEDAKLVYTVAENTADQPRTAEISVSCEGQTSIITVKQKAQTASYDNYTIESIYDFLDWASDYSMWKSSDKITLATDLDLTGCSYIPRDFPGTFDGQGYTIKGIDITLNSNVGFFTSLSGLLKNVTFGSAAAHGKITSTSTNAGAQAALVASLTGTGSIENVTSYVDVLATGSGACNVAGLVGLCSGTGTISGCNNYGSVTIRTTVISSCCLAGIVGEVSGNCTISNCNNYGDILNTAAAASNGGSFNMAGLLAKCTANATLENSNNSGAVTYDNSASTVAYANVNIAGLLGNTLTNPLAKFENCKNTSTAVITTKGPNKFVNGGGFIGYYNIPTPITNCTNEGNLVFESTSPYHYVGCGIGNIPLNVTAGVMSGCIVKADLTLTSASSSTSGLRAGLFAGAVGSSCSFDKCSAEGTVTNNSKSCKGTRLGGFIGSITGGSGTVKNCSAKYSVINSAAALPDAVQYMAGLVAYTTSFSFTDCTLEGAIKSTITSTTEVIGGVVGYCTNKNSGMTRCSSKCDITPADPAVLSKIGAFIGHFTVNPPVSSCSVYASTFAGIELTAANYGTYLKGSSSTAATNVNTTNVSFKEEQ